MSMLIRRALVSGAVGAVAAVGLALAPASAAVDPSLTCDDPAAIEAAVAEAKSEAKAARKAFAQFNRSQSVLIRAERREARIAKRESALEIRTLQSESRAADRTERKAVAAALRAERRELRHSALLLTSRPAVLDQIRSERAAARAEAMAAQRAYVELVRFAESCAEQEPVEEEAPVVEEEAPVEGA